MPTYRFGDFELDLDARQLRRLGEPLRLERRPFELLALLVTNPMRVHSRDDIIAALWPGKVIIDFESGLNTLVRKVRQVLGDSSDMPRFIETVSGVGYRFVAPVEVLSEPSPPDNATPAPVSQALAASRNGRRYGTAAMVVLAIAALLLFVRDWQMRDSPASNHTRIAVLPFENLTGDASLDYLASGLADETSLSLSRIELPEFAVIGGVSARAIAQSGAALGEVGHKYDIDYFVDSSLRSDDRRIRVTSRLIRASDGEQLWSESFDRELMNVLGLQRELSIAIAEQIRQRLSPDVAAAIDRRQTQNPKAYDLYLKGREQWMRFKPTLVEDSLRFYQQAVAIDPEYGLAWAGIAHAATSAMVTSDTPAAVTRPLARHALDMALRFGPDLAETYLALGAYRGFFEWDAGGTEAAMRRAIELDPNNAMAHMTLAMSLANQGKAVESRVEMQRARELDPLFPLIFANSTYIELVAGRVDEALEYSRQATVIDPEFWPGWFQLAFALSEKGELEAALQAFEKADQYSGGNSRVIARRSYLLSCLGRYEEARKHRDRLADQYVERYAPPYMMAVVEAGLGNTDDAFAWMNKAIEAGDVDPALFGADRVAGPDDAALHWITQPCVVGKDWLP